MMIAAGLQSGLSTVETTWRRSDGSRVRAEIFHAECAPIIAGRALRAGFVHCIDEPRVINIRQAQPDREGSPWSVRWVMRRVCANGSILEGHAFGHCGPQGLDRSHLAFELRKLRRKLRFQVRQAGGIAP